MTQPDFNLCIKNLKDFDSCDAWFSELETYEARDEWMAKNKVSERKSGYGTNGEYWEE